MGLVLYHHPNCSKSRQTLTLLEQHGIKPTVIDYLKTPPTREELTAIIAALGIAPHQLLRKKEKEYALAGLADKEHDDEAVIDAMLRYPRLIERPIAVQVGKAAIGRPPENVLSLL